MKKQFLFTVMLAVVALFTGQSAFAEYCKTTETRTRAAADRYLTSFTMSDGTNTVSVTGLQHTSYHGPCYLDKTASVLTTSAGATITPAVTWVGEWMHGYIWVDYNNNQIFEKDLEITGVPKANSELVSYTFLDVPNRNSKGLITTTDKPDYQLPSKLSELPFNIPAGLAAGDYRARLIIAWASDNPCGYTGMGRDGGAMIDFTIRVEVPIASRTITLKANPSVGGTVTGGGTHAGAIRCTAVPNPGYIFVNWTNETGGAEVSTSLTYTDNTEGDKTYVANFVQSYPIMSYYYTGDIKQTNRYLKTVTATQGANITTVFNATNESGLPRADFSGTFTEAGAIKTGALIDKTATPIVVDNGATSVSINFKAWTNNMTLGGVSKASELNWSQQAVFVDWNNNYSFLDAGENYGKSGDVDHDDAFTSTAGYTRNITIPANQPAGTYRMRVCYNEPQPSDDAWQNTLFTTLGSKTRNGKSYDFLITIKESTATKHTMTANVTPASSGSVTINDLVSPQDVPEGMPAVFKATPAAGFKFVNWTNAAVDVSTDNPYTITSVTEATTLTANFVAATAITVTANSSNATFGAATFTHSGGSATIYEGEDVTFTAVPTSTGVFKNWTASDGSVVSSDATYKVIAISAETALTANFIEKKAAPSASMTFNGSSQYVQIPNSVDFKMSTTEDLSISLWVKTTAATFPQAATRFLGYRIGCDNETAYELYTIKDNGYACTATGKAGTPTGTKLMDAVLGGTAGAWTHIAVVFDRTGTAKSHAYVNGIEVTAASKSITNELSFAGPQDILLGAGWNISKVISNYFAGDMGNVRLFKKALTASEVSVDASSEYTDLPATLKDKCVVAYKLDRSNISSTLTDLSGKNNNGVLHNFVVNYTVAADVTPVNSGTVTINDANSPQEIVSGSPAAFKATPAAGFKFVKWTKAGTDVSTDNPYTIASVTEATTLTANFAADIKTYAVSAIANPQAGGLVTLNGGDIAVDVNEGSTVALTASANAGYVFVNWTVGGVEVSKDANFTSAAITAVTDFVANFAVKTYAVSAIANPQAGGLVTLNGGDIAVDVNEGSTVALTASANAGYVFVNWTVGGVEVSKDANFTSAAITVVTDFVANFKATTSSNLAFTTANVVVNKTDAVGGKYTQTATVTDSKGAVAYSINDASIADINSATGELTIKALGKANITATQTAAGEYLETTATYEIWVKDYSGINFTTATVEFYLADNEYTQKANDPNTLSGITYSVAPKTASVDTNGKVTFSDTGKYTITATQAANGNYVETEATYVLNVVDNPIFTVSAAASPVGSGLVYVNGIISKDEMSEYGHAANLRATANSGYKFVKWMNDGKEVSTSATFTTELLKAASTYTAIFEAITKSNLAFTDNSAEITVGYASGNMYVNGASSTDSKGAISYKSNNADFVVTDGGIITMTATGTAIITATQAAEGAFAETIVSYTLKAVTPLSPNISWVETGTVTKAWDIKTYTPDLITKSLGLLTYRSNNKAVATINSAGLITLIGNGSATITANQERETGNGWLYESGRATFILQVIATGLEGSDLTAIKVWISGGMLNIDGVTAGDSIKAFTANGTIVYDGKAEGNTMSLEVPGTGLIIVKINGNVIKVVK